METLSIETVKKLLIWINEQDWCADKNGVWNNRFNSFEGGTDIDGVIECFLDNYNDINTLK